MNAALRPPARPSLGAAAAHVGLPLLLGGLVYVLWRTPTLWMFDWFDALGLTPMVAAGRALAAPLGPRLPHWLLYNFPDATWVYAATAAAALLWHDRGGAARWGWLSVGVGLAVGTELAQAAGVVRGSFDPGDLASYVAAFFAASWFVSNRWSA